MADEEEEREPLPNGVGPGWTVSADGISLHDYEIHYTTDAKEIKTLRLAGFHLIKTIGDGRAMQFVLMRKKKRKKTQQYKSVFDEMPIPSRRQQKIVARRVLTIADEWDISSHRLDRW